MGMKLSMLVREVKPVLSKLDINAIPISKDWANIKPGHIIELNNKFRTKNTPGFDDYMNNRYYLKGDLEKDPVIYIKNGNQKLILTLDPRWFTFTTAFVNFKMGWIDIAGIAIVKHVDNEQIIATPYVLGTPKSDMWNELIGFC